jgi:hypothetical protein
MHDQHLIWDDKEWREFEQLRKKSHKVAGDLTQKEFVIWAARRAVGGL